MTRPLRHILCVDDERDILDVARMCLQIIGGYEVSCCDSGREALEHAEHDPPDIILLDVMMPDMNGPDTLAALRSRPRLADIPVVFMTARVQPPELKAYFKLGVASVIAKPFEPMKLAEEVRQIWDACQPTPAVLAPMVAPDRPAALASAMAAPPPPALGLADDDGIGERLNALRGLYLDSLRAHAANLEAVVAAGALTADARALLKTTAHKLAGTGSTYGFRHISQAGRALDDEMIADPLADAFRLVELSLPLLDAVHAALEGAPTLPSPVAPVTVAAPPPPPAFGRRPSVVSAPALQGLPQRLPLILVADDDDAIRQLFTGLFAREARMIEAINCDQALVMMRHYQPDLLLLDDIMPGGVTGLRFMEDLQASGEFAHMPIIMITASDSAIHIQRGLNAGAVDYITKPFDAMDAAHRIRVVLNSRVHAVGM